MAALQYHIPEKRTLDQLPVIQFNINEMGQVHDNDHPTYSDKPESIYFRHIIAGGSYSPELFQEKRKGFFHAKRLSLARDQQIQVCIFQIEALAEIEIGQRPFEQVDTAAQVHLVPEQFFKTTLLSRFQQ